MFNTYSNSIDNLQCSKYELSHNVDELRHFIEYLKKKIWIYAEGRLKQVQIERANRRLEELKQQHITHELILNTVINKKG